MGEDQCSIEYEMPRKCQKCRLERCLAQGMRKDLLMTDEQKEQRRKRLEDNRNLTIQRSSTTDQPIPSTFDEIDRVCFHPRSIDFILSFSLIVIDGS